MKFLNFTVFIYGISIKYPSEWEKKEAEMDTVVAFLSPSENKSDVFRENLSIMIKDFFVKPTMLEECIEFEIDQLKEMFLDFRLIEKKRIRLSNIPAYKIVFTGRKQEIDVKIMQYYTLKKNRIYLLTYTAEIDKYDKFLKTVNKMIKSFRFI